MSSSGFPPLGLLGSIAAGRLGAGPTPTPAHPNILQPFIDRTAPPPAEAAQNGPAAQSFGSSGLTPFAVKPAQASPSPPRFTPPVSGTIAPGDMSADTINRYLQDTPMKNTGDVFMGIGQKYGLDPRFLVAIAGAESSFGKNITRGQYNALNDLYNGVGKDAPFSSWERAINGAAFSLTHQRNAYDLSSTAKMYPNHYCVGAGCDVGLKNLNRFMREQGADPNALGYPKIQSQ